MLTLHLVFTVNLKYKFAIKHLRLKIQKYTWHIDVRWIASNLRCTQSKYKHNKQVLSFKKADSISYDLNLLISTRIMQMCNKATLALIHAS